jgi:hypothetical protein
MFFPFIKLYYLKVNSKMIYISLMVIAIGLISVSFYILWINRSSESILTNFVTVFILGAIGLLTTSVISLKDETKKDEYAACMFIRGNPFWLMNYGVKLQSNRTHPIIMTNNCIEAVSKKDSTFFSTIKGWKSWNDLLIRYIFDLLQYRYRGSWYIKSVEFKLPNGLSGNSWPVEHLKQKVLTNETLKDVFKDNIFINVGYYNDKEDTTKNQSFNIKFPPNTDLKYTFDSLQESKVIMENNFVSIEIKFRPTLGLGSLNKEICSAYEINQADSTNYNFLPFLIETKTTFKKFRTGHPDMEKYKYWANDLTTYIKTNISIDEFWSEVELNQKSQ